MHRTIGHSLRDHFLAPNGCVIADEQPPPPAPQVRIVGKFNPDAPADQILTSKEQFEARYGVPFRNKGSGVGERVPDMAEVTARAHDDNNPFNLVNHKAYVATIADVTDLRYVSQKKQYIFDTPQLKAIFAPKPPTSTPPPKDPLVIPEAVQATMKEVMTWEKLGPGRLTRIKAWIDWLNEEVARRK